MLWALSEGSEPVECEGRQLSAQQQPRQRTYILPFGECEFQLNSILEELQVPSRLLLHSLPPPFPCPSNPLSWAPHLRPQLHETASPCRRGTAPLNSACLSLNCVMHACNFPVLTPFSAVVLFQHPARIPLPRPVCQLPPLWRTRQSCAVLPELNAGKHLIGCSCSSNACPAVPLMTRAVLFLGRLMLSQVLRSTACRAALALRCRSPHPW